MTTLYTVQEVANAASVDYRMVRQWWSRGWLPAVAVTKANRPLFDQQTVKAFLARRAKIKALQEQT